VNALLGNESVAAVRKMTRTSYSCIELRPHRHSAFARR
jgi:hypothetical protein